MKALFPGTFDPFTYGHLDVLRKAKSIFSHIVIGVASLNYKENLLSSADRCNIIYIYKSLFPSEFKNVSVFSYDYSTFMLAKNQNIEFIIRGIRGSNDIDYEMNMSFFHDDFKLQTVFIPAYKNRKHISSSELKNIIKRSKNTEEFIPNEILKLII